MLKIIMKSKCIVVVLLTIVLTCLNPLAAKAAINNKMVPQIRGEAACLIDVQSGQVLYSKNADKLLAPASTTKIMTGLLAFEKGSLDSIVTASETMLDYQINYGTRIYLEPGEQLSLEDMLYALLLNSANDAALAIAEHISGDIDGFVDMMNERAEAIGATNTTFKNPSGLNEDGHLTTAYDLARIAQGAYQNPKFKEYIQTKSHVIPRSQENVPIEMINENKLLWRDSIVTGMKTGYTSVAQNCLVASANLDDRDVIGVILKSPGSEIYTDMLDLLYYGLDEFVNSPNIQVGDVISTVQIDDQVLNLLASEPLWVTRKIGNLPPKFTHEIVPISEEVVRVEAGQVMTQLNVWDGDELIKSIPLVADRDIEPKTFKVQYFGFSLIAIVLGGLFLKPKKGHGFSKH